MEGERAFLLRRLMEMRESRGDLEGAASASREIQVEVCNALSSREKAEFLIEQVGLNMNMNMNMMNRFVLTSWWMDGYEFPFFSVR